MPLAADIPVEGLEGGILFSGLFYADRARRVAWVMGGRQHVPRIYLRIGYGEALDGGEAPVTLFYVPLLWGKLPTVAHFFVYLHLWKRY